MKQTNEKTIRQNLKDIIGSVSMGNGANFRDIINFVDENYTPNDQVQKEREEAEIDLMNYMKMKMPKFTDRFGGGMVDEPVRLMVIIDKMNIFFEQYLSKGKDKE